MQLDLFSPENQLKIIGQLYLVLSLLKGSSDCSFMLAYFIPRTGIRIEKKKISTEESDRN